MPAIFIDLDGTLIDPKEGITRSIQYALQELGAEVPSQDELTWCIGPPLWDSFRALLGERGDVNEAVALYRERFTEKGVHEAEVYQGVDDMLLSLRETGLPIFIATSKPHAYAGEIAENFGLNHYIDGLFGSELDGTNSDKTDLLAHALAETGADPFKSVMIGDRRHDIEGAVNNDICTVGALWGYGEPDELHAAEADALAGAPADVAELVADLLDLGAE